MKLSDVPSAMELSAAANWNQTQEDWLRIIRLAGDGCRCIEDSGKVVATTCLLSYDPQLAWIGMVLTSPQFRKRGFALRLMEDALRAAETKGIRTIKLDATDSGRPLYERFGFVVEQLVERWSCEEPSGELLKDQTRYSASGYLARPSCVSEEIAKLDESAFGVGRLALLKALLEAGNSHIASDGYVLSRSGRLARYLGPCVAASAAEARSLIAALLADPANKQYGWCWDLLPANQDAVHCATEFGFTRDRVLWRMRRGEAIDNTDALVYAIAGFELG